MCVRDLEGAYRQSREQREKRVTERERASEREREKKRKRKRLIKLRLPQLRKLRRDEHRKKTDRKDKSIWRT